VLRIEVSMSAVTLAVPAVQSDGKLELAVKVLGFFEVAVKAPLESEVELTASATSKAATSRRTRVTR
jgi:hypothetical protein